MSKLRSLNLPSSKWRCFFMVLVHWSSTLRWGRGVYGLLCHRQRRLIQSSRYQATYEFTTTKIQSSLSSETQQSPLELPKLFKSWLDVQVPEGRVIGVEMLDIETSDPDAITPENIKDMEHWAHSMYHPDEVSYGIKLKPGSSSSFWMGRMAMRIALDFPDYPILKDCYGRPQLSPGICGSISHKENKGVALVSASTSSDPTQCYIGIDLELIERPGKRSIAGRILTENEQNTLGNIPDISTEQEVMLRFSLKEAIYKAAHPLLCQYVGFKEAEVTPHEDGTATCDWFLDSEADERLGKLTAHWRLLEDEGYFLTSASVEPR